MKKENRFSIVIFMTILLSANAHAADGRYILGIGIGKSQYQANTTEIIASNASLSSAATIDDNSTAFSLFAGFKLDEYLSMEIDILTGDSIIATDTGRTFKIMDVDTFAISLAMSKQVLESTRLFARLGVHNWMITKASDESTTDALDLTYGLGADINIYGDLSRQMRVQWNHYEYDGVLINKSDAITISLLFTL